MLNFRKVLALVLVIATLFSFATVASASFADLDEDFIPAEDVEIYEDEDKINEVYFEAVRVLSFAGILNGYENGTFQADNNIRRNEMAKMIAVLANAGYDVDELYATAAEFEDVPTSDWAASYVAYCAKTGIVAGRSETIFDPNASVTGLETAKMLLVVLGFDAEHQGYVGADWAVNVLRDAKVMGLLEGFEASYNVNAAITREEAAHMMLNALKAPCVVGFLSDDVITVTNALVFGEWDADRDFHENMARVINHATLKDALNEETWALYGNVVISDDLLSTELFGFEATLGEDCYGRPATVWVDNSRRNNDRVLGTFAFEPDFYSYDTNVDEVEDFLYGLHDTDYTLYYYMDGADVNGSLTPETPFTGDLQALVDNMEQMIGKGVEVEIYVNDVEETIHVIVVNTFIGEVVDVNMARGEVTIGGDVARETADNNWGFNSADEGETVVLFWICRDGFHDVEAIEPEVATVTRADVDGRGNHSFRADGETYEYAENFGLFLGGHMFGTTDDFWNEGNREHLIYTDKFGYVMWTDENDNANTEIVVIDGDSWVSDDFYMTADGPAFKVNTCDFIYFEEGAPIKTVDTTLLFNAGEVGTNNGDADILAWVNYVDEETITKTNATAANTASGTIWLQRGQVKIQQENAADTDPVFDALVNNNTQIIVRVPDYFGEEDDDFTYLYFDGINEIDANYVAEDFQYFLDSDCEQEGEGRYITHIYVDAQYAMEENRAFVLRSAGSTIEMVGDNRVLGGDKYEAIVNGEEAIVVYRDRMELSEFDRVILEQFDNVVDDQLALGYPKMIKSDMVMVGYTLDDMPVWVQANPDDETIQATNPDYVISGGVLSWWDGDNAEWDGIRMDPDCAIWVATPDRKGEFVAELKTQEEFNDYRAEYGWEAVNGYSWAVDAEDETGRTDGLADYLLVVVIPA